MSIHNIRPHGQPVPGTWNDRLLDASSEFEVVAVCRDFTARLAPEEIAALPDNCRPPHLVDGNDIAAYAFDLVRNRCDDGVSAHATAHQLAAFFAAATARLARILHEHRGDRSDAESA